MCMRTCYDALCTSQEHRGKDAQTGFLLVRRQAAVKAELNPQKKSQLLQQQSMAY